MIYITIFFTVWVCFVSSRRFFINNSMALPAWDGFNTPGY
jgi:hypothetical protein